MASEALTYVELIAGKEKITQHNTTIFPWWPQTDKGEIGRISEQLKVDFGKVGGYRGCFTEAKSGERS